MSFDNIPEELRALNQWVCWKYVEREGKATKVPINARSKSGKEASTTDPETWSSFTRAVKASVNCDGIGFVFTREDPYIGIDLDDNDDWGEIYEDFNTYTELSPSGQGIHIVGIGKSPEDKGRHPKGVGIFEHSRYFTFTGSAVNDDPLPIRNIQDRINQYWPIWIPEKPKMTAPPPSDWYAGDDEVLDRLQRADNGAKFIDLYVNGDLSAYQHNQSEADLALLSLMTFYTQDPGQLDRLFRRSALYRDKWERADYREMTITKALDRSEFYTPPLNGPSGVTIRLSGKSSGPEEGLDKENSHKETVESENEPAKRKGFTTWNTTDTGNGMRLAHHHGRNIRYVPEWGRWLLWNGRQWAMDDGIGIMALAKETVRTIYAEAGTLDDKDDRKKMISWAIRSEAGARLREMVALCQSEPGIKASNDELDANPMLLNARNGTVDLATGVLHPHAPENLMTHCSPVRYDLDATCPRWHAFLDRIMGGNHSLIGFLKRAVGYSLSGSIAEQVIFILYGNGQNGKSVLINVIARVLADYASTIPTERLMARHGDGAIPNDLARLTGKRFVSSTETTDGRRLDEAMVKAISGGDTIPARFFRQEFFDLAPQFKLWLATNYKPVIRGTDKGIWRRIRLIPFTVEIPDGERDLGLTDFLVLNEAPGILNWMLEGCLEWQEAGLSVPQDVIDATSYYREEMDVFGRFVSEHCLVDPNNSESSSSLYGVYKSWADENGEFQMTNTAFGRKLAEIGMERKVNFRGVTGASWLGIRLRTKMDRETSYLKPVPRIQA